MSGADKSLGTQGFWMRRLCCRREKDGLLAIRVRARLLFYGVLILTLSGGMGLAPLVSQTVHAQQAEANPYANDPNAVEEANTLFTQICSHCHGMKGEGALARSMIGNQWLKASTDKAVYSVIANGRKNTQMTPYEALGEDMIWKLVVLVRRLQEGA